MPQIDWTPDMHIGVAEIDAQHEKLTGMINALCYAYMDGKEREVLSPIINELHDYAHYHFTTEEKYMKQLGERYDFIEQHRAKHGEFFSTVIDFLLRYVSGEDTELTPELLDYLTDWWRDHIMGVDQGLGEVIRRVESGE
ncbi:hemerythrin [Oceanidesulfovibrio indonesiensis]|jgi:hemerythrin|uniref:Hemerythrin n=1 Tax=Oceanidesulfovibrio indonesiensis TaxID=54767 RepID=A0A7M3MCV8_9BACT|nr:bacteriohemerythrin [Oceanidesulfovibrio indonesiensis]TVM16270.1 hemerythrin [Oceanidesulfovibrio indonesiensis]